MRYARKADGGWQIETVDTEGFDGQTSLARDGLGTPHIRYCTLNGELRLATREWSGSTVNLKVNGIDAIYPDLMAATGHMRLTLDMTVGARSHDHYYYWWTAGDATLVLLAEALGWSRS